MTTATEEKVIVEIEKEDIQQNERYDLIGRSLTLAFINMWIPVSISCKESGDTIEFGIEKLSS